MIKDYIINGETVVMMSISNSSCRIYETEKVFDVDISLKEILEESCKYFGSSLEGRTESSKYHLKYDYKLPIIIDENREIIIFPTKSYNSLNSYVIFINQIKDYEKTDNGIKIILKNNKVIEINESFGIFENQYLRSLKLLNALKNMKKIS